MADLTPDFNICQYYLDSFYEETSRQCIQQIIQGGTSPSVMIESLVDAGMPIRDAFFILALLKLTSALYDSL